MRDVVIYAESPGFADATTALLRNLGDLRSVTFVCEAEEIWPLLAASAEPLLILCVPKDRDHIVGSLLDRFSERWKAYAHVPVLATHPFLQLTLGAAALDDAARGRFLEVSADELTNVLGQLGTHVSVPASRRLSPRQQAVARLVVEGLTNTQIARQLGCSTATVKAHLALIFRKFGVSNRVGVARSLLEHGAS